LAYRPRVGIIGAGPAGLTAAYRLQQKGAQVFVFEASHHVGGLARSLDLWGHRVDLGLHRFFINDARVNGFWHEVLGSEYRMVERQTRIYYRGRLFDYPLRIGNVLVNLGLADIVASLASYAKEKFARRQTGDGHDSFEAWVVRHLGRRLYEMFFKSYSEKLWGIPCTELDADFAAQRIRRFSLGQSVLAALGIGKQQHKTLVDRFAYPKAGSGQLYEHLTKAIGEGGGSVQLASPVARVVAEDGKVTGLELQDGSTHAFDHVISTMPLTLLLRGLDPPAAISAHVARLRFRNTILVYLKVEATGLFTDQWIYIHSGEVMVGRVTNFRNWVQELYGELKSTVLAMEYWCYDDDAIWMEPDSSLTARAEREIRATGLLGSADIAAGHVVRLRHSYPVYARGYRGALSPVVAYLRTLKNLWPIGRYGSFKYNNQDHSILMGLLVADNICDDAAHDLWSVNADYDSYQESAS
jgi:protoporphyrinogen oxidase